MKILILTPDFPKWDGGIATVAYELAKAFDSAGSEVTVCAPWQTAGDGSFDQTLPFRIIRLKNIKDKHLKYYYWKYLIYRIVKTQKPDIIFANSWYPAGTACAGMGVPYTVFIHGNELLSRRFASKLWRKRLTRSFENCLGVLANSNKILSLFKDAYHINVPGTAVYCGVDIEKFRPISVDRELFIKYHLTRGYTLLTVGRLVKRKGQKTVIAALPLLRDEFPQLRYILAGRGSYEEDLKQLTRQLGVEDMVRFTGFVSEDQKVTLYNLCDIYVMPSEYYPDSGDIEGFGITYLEANACGKPVIGSNTGGVADAVQDGISGLLIEPDAPAKLAETIRLLLVNKNERLRLGQAGMARVQQQFTWSRIAQAILDQYEDWLPSKMQIASACERSRGPVRSREGLSDD